MRQALTLDLPGVATGWTIRNVSDAAARALADRHYSRQHPGSPTLGPPGHRHCLVTPDERAVWLSHYTDYPDDGLDAWRCSIFRNEGPELSSDLIRSAMTLTEQRWGHRPDGWVTWVDPRKVTSPNPGYCFLKAGWWRDRGYEHPHLIRLRAGGGR